MKLLGVPDRSIPLKSIPGRSIPMDTSGGGGDPGTGVGTYIRRAALYLYRGVFHRGLNYRR